MAVHSIEFCAGVGMLGEGLRAGFEYLGLPHRTVCYVEREAHAAAVLVARMEEGSLDAAPVWSDLLTFDAQRWSGCVDFVVAGFPCQDLSVAGRRVGLDGARSGLFFDILDHADACDATGLFLENVGGIASASASVVDEAEGDLEERAAARVLGELADRGWDAEWLTLSASDVGASHGRLRWFCLAWRRLETPSVSNSQDNEYTRDRGQEGYERLTLTGQANTWPTPMAGMGENSHGQISGDFRRNMDAILSENWPTPRSTDGAKGGPNQAGSKGDQMLPSMAAHWPMVDGKRLGSARPTPASRDHKGQDLPSRNGGASLSHAAETGVFSHSSPQVRQIPGGPDSSPATHTLPRRLNPLFVEWLMGWPLQWTNAVPHASSAAATASWRSALQQRLSCLLDAQASPAERLAA